MKQSSLQLVFHSHLPFIKHGQNEWYLEQMWLFEAISESYLPMIRMLNSVNSNKINITMSLSPTLMSMLSDSYFMNNYRNYLNKFLELIQNEVKRLENDDIKLQKMANYYLELTKSNIDYMSNNINVLNGFKTLDYLGKLKLITTSATYSYYPAYQPYPQMNKIQTKVGLSAFRNYIGKNTKTFLLPECGYYENLDKILKKCDVEFSYLAPNGVLFSSKPPEYGVFNPIKTKHNVIFFVQDLKSNNLITAMDGYPSNPVYRDFFRDIGYDLDFDYVKDHISPNGHRILTGVKYHAISKSVEKNIYDIDLAKKVAKEHAKEYVSMQENRALNLINNHGIKNPVFVNFYSTELFGHRWFEGFFFLEELINLVEKSEILDLSTAESYFSHDNPMQDRIKKVKPLLSSWMGYSSFYIDEKTSKIYRDLHKSVRSFLDLIKRHKDAKKVSNRLLSQSLRELLLSQSLDWLMIMKNGISSDYANSRINNHLLNYFRIEQDILNLESDIDFLLDLEKTNNIFPFISKREDFVDD